MKTMVLTTKTNHNPLNLDDLGGGGICFAITSSFTYRYTEPSAGVRQWHLRKALCVSDKTFKMLYHCNNKIINKV